MLHVYLIQITPHDSNFLDTPPPKFNPPVSIPIHASSLSYAVSVPPKRVLTKSFSDHPTDFLSQQTTNHHNSLRSFHILRRIRVCLFKGIDEVLLLLIIMPIASSTPRSSAYLTALTQEIDKKLLRALDSPSQRRNLLQELFADIALEVDDRARDIILGGEDITSGREEEIRSSLCFYEVLADHFALVPDNGKPILDMIVQLWSQAFASHIFALLFHKWLFEVQLDNYDVLLRYSSALVQGATNVFWIDIQTNSRHFHSLFRYLLEEVALVPKRLKNIPLQGQRDLFLLLSRFIFLYNIVNKIGSFLQQCPEFPNAFLIGGPADIFVIELADQLQKLKVEPVLLHYLSQVKVLRGLELRMTTSTRLKTCLYSFTSPGGPMYPTRAVRHAAWDALNFLFPVGQYPRHLISLFFRLLYPWYWPSSCWNFIISCFQVIMYSLLRLIFPSWEKLRRPH